MLLLLENVIKVRICHTIHGYAKAKNKYTKNHDKKKNHHILSLGTIIYLNGRYLRGYFRFKWTEETCQINEDFIKGYNDDNDEVDVQYFENLHNLHNDFAF